MYSTLNSTHSEIRIARLQAGDWDDDIKISLHIVSLDKEPQYTAISYVWGDSGHLTNIIVDDQSVTVRQNLKSVLRRMRNDSQGVQQIWIDAICINQLDEKERSEQVALMGRIYISAKDCLLWLGEATDEPTQPFQHTQIPNPSQLQSLKKMVQDLKLASPKPLQTGGVVATGSNLIDVSAAYEIVELLATGKHFYEMPFYSILPSGDIEMREDWAEAMYSLANILQRAWWGRIWTAQEAFLSNRAQIRIGPHKMLFSSFMKATAVWLRHLLEESTPCCILIHELLTGSVEQELRRALDLIADFAALYEARSNLEQSVAHNVFLLAIHRSALLPHDYIYGMLGIVEEFFQLDEAPDYSREVAELYSSTTVKFMKNAGSLCLISYARPQLLGSSVRHLPSWTPDWSTRAWGDYFDIHNHGGFAADGLLVYDGAHVGHKILKLEGIAVDKVSRVGTRIQDMNLDPEMIVPRIQELLDLAEEQGLSHRVLWEIIHVATHKDMGLELIDRQEAWWEQMKEFAHDRTPLEDVMKHANGTPYYVCLSSMAFLDRRGVFVTEPVSMERPDVRPKISEYRSTLPNGSMGMALQSVEAGDLIFVVKGARTPLVLRPLSEESLRENVARYGVPAEEIDRCYTFVGVCYIHGMMQGQAVSDSTNWRSIYVG